MDGKLNGIIIDGKVYENFRAGIPTILIVG